MEKFKIVMEGKKFIPVGQIFDFGLIRVKCLRVKNLSCEGCFFLKSSCRGLFDCLGPCTGFLRDDNCNVVFVECDENDNVIFPEYEND